MARRVQRKIRRPRALNGLNGLLSSLIRTLLNVYFIGSTLVALYFFNNADSLKPLTELLVKTTLFKKIGTWLAANHYQASAIIYSLLFSFLCVSNRFSIICAFLSVLTVYMCKPSTNFLEYFGLAIAFCWFFRTKSNKIRFVIIILFLIFYIVQWWGVSLFG